MPWRLRTFFDQLPASSLIEAKKLPSLPFTAVAASADLPNAHDGIPVLGFTNSVHFDGPHVAIINYLQQSFGG